MHLVRSFAWFWSLRAFLLATYISIPTGLIAQNSTNSKKVPEPPRVVIPRLRGTVRIDGDLSETVWKKAALIRPLSFNDGSGPEREQTEVRLWYDGTALYLGWTCRDSDIQATFTNRDSHFWDEEVA